MNTAKLKQFGEEQWRGKGDKINAELFVMTYGALVKQLWEDYEDIGAVNSALDRMGYGIGVRLIEEFLAKHSPGLAKCRVFAETADVVASVGFKVFLNASVGVSHITHDEYSLTLLDNPLNRFVALPDSAVEKGLLYSNILAGCVRGALEMVNMHTAVTFTEDELLGHQHTTINVKLLNYIDEHVPDDE
ncbi:hypothetical protein E3P84_01391 [Wallemia ichthyophaga]|nr:hypothetical protein E3P84_01391 [Wallemia ichthyophaga]TIB42268.1 hypothetical protein E3P83_01340 [Wallemia ichthyophaga]